MGISTQQLLKHRIGNPACPGFDKWFTSPLLESLEPLQAGIVIYLLEQGGQARSDVMACHFEMTPHQLGSAVSDLRKLGLMTSAPIEGEPTRATMHTVAGWLQEAWKQ